MPLLIFPIISAILSPIWGFLKALWATEFGRICLISFACLVIGWLKGYGHVPGAVKKAEERRDQHWTQQIEKANNDHQRELQDALDEASKVAPIDPTRDARIKLCRDPKAGADCREHGQRM